MKLLNELRQGTLFARTTLIITVTSFLFITFTLGLLALFIVIPTAERSAKELTTNMFLAADIWHQSNDERRSQLSQLLEQKYQIGITRQQTDLKLPTNSSPFFYLVRKEVERRIGEPVTIYESPHDDASFWADGIHTYWIPLKIEGDELMVSFRYGHPKMEPPLTILIILTVGLFATLITSLTLARRLTKPLEQLSSAAKQIGQGDQISELPEQGPVELMELVHSFNTMARQIQDLLANRTTLLTGISHDLRTPLTRMELALEMLGDSADPTLLEPLHRDIEQMNRLIGLFLEVSQEMHEEQRQTINIVPLLRTVVEDHRRTYAEIELETGHIPLLLIHPLALQRIVNNLLENAIRYGGGRPIKVICKSQVIHSSNVITIDVMDRGQGIPESEREAVFRPFHRLDKSRNSTTEGTGLGLSITRQLAQANGCKVELLPREGGGTIARITIGLSKTGE